MKGLGWIIALCGLWEFADIVAPFVPGFGKVPSFVWNHIFVGFIWMIAGIWAARTWQVNTAKVLNWISAAAGLWLIIATFILRSPTPAAGLLNDLIVGVIVIILSVWAAISTPRAAD